MATIRTDFAPPGGQRGEGTGAAFSKGGRDVHCVSQTAVINARQLAAFREFLRVQGERLDMTLLDPDFAEDDYLSYRFEARVCPLALASIARIFDYQTDVITVLDEAQFRGRRVSVYREGDTGPITLSVGLTSDPGLELDLAYQNAFALLEGLGLRPESVGEIPVDNVRARLADPSSRRSVEAQGAAADLSRLDRLSATGDLDDSSRLEWA